MHRFTVSLWLSLSTLACSSGESNDAGGATAGAGGSAGSAGNAGSAGAGPDYLPPGERGPYPVGIVTVEFIDESRDEQFNPMPVAGEKRLLDTDIWYPAAESARGEAGADGVGAMDAAIAEGGPFPLVVFSHGNTGIKNQSSFLTAHLASHGYVVVSPNHRFNTLADYNIATLGGAGLVQRSEDVSFLVDTMIDLGAEDPDARFTGKIDPERVGITGHSYGGATTLLALTQDARFLAGAPITAGGVSELAKGITDPTMHFLATEDHTVGLTGNAKIEEMYTLSDGPKMILRIRDAGHFSPSVACDVVPASFADDGCERGTRLLDPTQEFEFLDHKIVFDILNLYEAALFGYYLKQVDAYADDLSSMPFGEDVEIERDGMP